MESGEYNRAINLVYDRIIAKDSLTLADRAMLERVLRGTVFDKVIIDKVKSCCRFRDKQIVIVEQKDSICFFDFKCSQTNRYKLPEDSLYYYTKDRWGEKYIILSAKDHFYVYNRSNPSNLYYIDGVFKGFADDEKYILSKTDSMLFAYKYDNKPELIDSIRVTNESYIVKSNKSSYIAIQNKKGEPIIIYNLSTKDRKQINKPECYPYKLSHNLLILGNRGREYNKREIYDLKTLKSIGFCEGGSCYFMEGGDYQFMGSGWDEMFFYKVMPSGIIIDTLKAYVSFVNDTILTKELLTFANRFAKQKSYVEIVNNECIAINNYENFWNHIKIYDIGHGDEPIHTIDSKDFRFIKGEHKQYYYYKTDDSISICNLEREVVRVSSESYIVDNWVCDKEYGPKKLFPIENPDFYHILRSNIKNYYPHNVEAVINNTAFILLRSNNKNDYDIIKIMYVGNSDLEELIDKTIFLDNTQKKNLKVKLKRKK